MPRKTTAAASPAALSTPTAACGSSTRPVSRELGQPQVGRLQSDGYSFEKNGTTVIRENPTAAQISRPKVGRCGGFTTCPAARARMASQVLLSVRIDLLPGSTAACCRGPSGGPLDGPDCLPLDGRGVLMFSMIGRERRSTQFVVGDSTGSASQSARADTEEGPHFYAPRPSKPPDAADLFGWLSAVEEARRGADYPVPDDTRGSFT